MLRRSVNPWAVIWTTALAQLLRLACLVVLWRSYRIRAETSTELADPFRCNQYTEDGSQTVGLLHWLT